MTPITFAALAALVALAVTIPAVAVVRHWRAQAAAWEHAYRAECRRHNTTLRQSAEREAEAARYIVALCVAVEDAAGSATEPERQPVRVGGQRAGSVQLELGREERKAP